MLFALLASLLIGCTPIGETLPAGCLLSGQKPVVVAELFFGRAIAGRQPLSEAEWSEFAGSVITRSFPDGFTVIDGAGQWQNPETHEIALERTKILLVAARRAPDLAARLSAVIDAYKARFRQESVGVITRDSCASF